MPQVLDRRDIGLAGDGKGSAPRAVVEEPQAALAALKQPLPAWHPMAWYYGLTRLALGSIGRLSAGVRIGLDHGFDSGVMLDHVYRNEADGIGSLGRMFDRLYLDAPGWVGIRNRRALLSRILAKTLAETLAARAAQHDEPVVVADLACGGGRYLLDALGQVDADGVQATLRDYRPENVAAARANAARLGLSVLVEQADAFSDWDFVRLGPCDLVVVSGLHEIIEADAPVRRHFEQIARILKPGGELIVTLQPDHPQLEFMARVLTTHTGAPWAMRLRPVALIRDWAEAAGFVPIEVEMEPTGIFGVMRLRRP